jgi:PAS domain-containing protein
MASLAQFWGIGLLMALVWLVLSDAGYRLAKGRFLEVRLPLVGGLTLLLVTLLHRVLPMGSAALSWSSALLGGALLGLVAMQQLIWLRRQGLWVEGRGDGFRVALSALESDLPPEGVPLSYRIEAQQPILLLDDRGLILEANEAFARLIGVQRHQLRGFELQGMFQGRDRGVWESLRQQLLRDAHGSATATLVRPDASFNEVVLETVVFDRNMALVWLSDASPGTLAVRSRGQGAFLPGGGGDRERTANAIASLLAATERMAGETQDPILRNAAQLARASALRLSAIHGNAGATRSGQPVKSLAALNELLPRVSKVLPDHGSLRLEAEDLDLLAEPEDLERMVLQLVLEALGRECGAGLTLSLRSVQLGGRPWALLEVGSQGPARGGASRFLGLGWLQGLVTESRGMLELAELPEGGQHLRIYLPVAGGGFPLELAPLAGRQVWIVDSDSLLREALGGLVQGNGGRVELFPDLRAFLRAGRNHPLPDVAVLERTPRLDRFHRALRRMRVEAVPTLVLGNGDLIPASSLGTGLPRVGFLEKPFFGQEFVQGLLALLNSEGRAG